MPLSWLPVRGGGKSHQSCSVMRLGVDATGWSNKRGYGRFTRGLLHAVVALDRKNSYVLFVDSDEQLFELPRGVEVVSVPTRVPAVQAASARGRRSLRDLWMIGWMVAQQRLDAVFFPSVYTFFPIPSRVPKLVTIHDTFPEMFPQLVFPTRAAQFFWKSKVFLSRLQADLILTVSEYSRRCLTQYLGISPARTRVVEEAGDPVFQPLVEPDCNGLMRRYGMAACDPFVLYVGGFSPHKNLSMLIEVFQTLLADARLRNLRLVLVGDYTGDSFYSCYPELREKVAAAGLDDRVVFTGFVPDSELVYLLNLARVVVLPSFAEGFGLPAIEAAACGTPVVATTASPLPELLGAGGLYVSPTDRPGLLAALTRVLTDRELHRRMSKAALQAARRLTWENSARRLLSIFEEVAGRRHGETT